MSRDLADWNELVRLMLLALVEREGMQNPDVVRQTRDLAIMRYQPLVDAIVGHLEIMDRSGLMARISRLLAAAGGRA